MVWGQVVELEELFELIDMDGSGAVDREEIAEVAGSCVLRLCELCELCAVAV